MDIYQLLMRDHRQTEEVFSVIEKTSATDVRRREQLFENLRKRLETHGLMEENIFYPEIERIPDDQGARRRRF